VGIARLADGIGAGRGRDVGLHAQPSLTARGRALVVVGVRARRAVGDVDVLGHTHARLAARGLAAAGDGGDGVAGVVGRAGVTGDVVDVRSNALPRFAAGRLAAPGDGGDGVAGVVDRANRAVRDRDVLGHTD